MELLKPKYIEALRAFRGDQPIAADANGTLRITYGTVRGYRPSPEAKPYEPFTTLTQVIGKNQSKDPFDVPGRLSYCFENTGTEPVVFYRNTPAGQVPSYPESETPKPIAGYRYEKALIRSTGGYEGVNQPYLDFNAYAAAGGKSRDFAFDGHTAAHIIRANGIAALPPATSWGHFHENMVEAWVVVEGHLAVLISGIGLVHGEVGDVINANEGRWHRATCEPNTGTCTRWAMTPRNKEGQVHYFQTDQPPGN